MLRNAGEVAFMLDEITQDFRDYSRWSERASLIFVREQSKNTTKNQFF